MKKDNILQFRNKRCKELEEERYIEGAINCLAQIRFLSKDPNNNAIMLPYILTSVRGIFHCIKHTNITLEDIGTSEKELRAIVSPPELNLNKKESENRWNMVIKK